mgnify:CR=1 FL=1
MAKPPSKRSTSGEITQFLHKSKAITAFVSHQPRLLFAIDATASRAGSGSRAAAKPDIAQEAESALIALGYKPTDAAKIISRVASESVSDAGELIRLALKSMGS